MIHIITRAVMRELYDSDLQGFVDILDDNVLELTTIHTIDMTMKTMTRMTRTMMRTTLRTRTRTMTMTMTRRPRPQEACKFSRGAGYCTGVRQGGPRRHHHHLVRHYYIHHHPCCQFIFFDVDFKTQWPPIVTVMNNTNHHHCLSFIMIHHDSLSFIITYHDHWTHALPKTDICQYHCKNFSHTEKK